MKTAKRALQLAKIGLAAGRLARSRGDTDRQIARKALAGLFADARGVAMKVGQLMAGTDDADPLANLVTGIEAMPLSEIAPEIEAGIGRPLAGLFETIEESEAAASLGQVHRARLRDGTTVAIKVRYPGIKDAVAAELRLAGLMPGVGPVRKWGFDVGGYKAQLKNNMDRELDYRSEAERQVRFAQRVRVPGLIVPRVHTALSSEQVLVQDWHAGQRLSQVAGWPVAERAQAGRILLATLFTSLFEAGEVHGDPHPGNSYFRRGADVGPPGGVPGDVPGDVPGGVQVVLMDYGCTVAVDEGARLALLKLILALREGSALSPLQAFAAMGFDAEKLAAIAGTLSTLASMLLRPFITEGPFFVAEWHLKDKFEALLGENRWWFRAAGPPSGILLLRAFQGLVQQMAEIKTGVDWGRVLMGSVSPATLDRARAFELPALPAAITEAAARSAGSLNLARHLRVEVTRDAEKIVSLSMPAEAALKLQELIPEEVLAHIHSAPGIDLGAILAAMRERGLAPQEILGFDKPPKHYRIWLE